MQHFTKFGRETHSCLLQALLIVFFLSTSAMYAQAPSSSFKIWDKTIGGNEDDKLSIIIPASDGGYLLGGTSASRIGQDKSAPNYGNSDFWIVKLNENGVKQWDRTYGGTGMENLGSIVAVGDGGYLLGGASASPVSGNLTQPGKGKEDYWIVKINSSGIKEWDKRYGGNENDALATLVKAPDGGYLLGGSSYSGVSGDKTEPNKGGYQFNVIYSDFWVVKINSMGEKQWDKTFGGGMGDPETQWSISSEDNLTSIALSPDGGYLLGGTSSSSYGDRTCGSADSWNDEWVVKISANGTKQWDKCYSSPENDYLTSIIPTSDGGYLVGGYGSFEFLGGNSWTDYHVVKINNNGDVQWRKLFGGDFNEQLGSMIATPDGGYLLGGHSTSDVGGDKTEPKVGDFYNTSYDYWIVKINASGEKQWDKVFGGDNSDILTSLTLTPTGSYLLGGYSPSSMFADKSERSRGRNDFWIIKTSTQPSPEVELITFEQTSQGTNIGAIVSNPNFASKVEFYVDGVKIGEDMSAPFQHALINSAPGTHYVYAKVFDKEGNSIASYTRPITISSPASYFYRGVNLNGPALFIDDNQYQSSNNNPDFTFQARSFENQSVNLVPATDPYRAQMLRSSLYATRTAPAVFTFTNVLKRAYEVYLYVWEDNYAQTFSISVNGSVALANYNSGNKGHWEKLGPFKTNAGDDGNIVIKVEGGDANISGIELRSIFNSNYDYESFYRAVNLNGPTYKINNLSYEGSAQAANFSYQARAFANQSVSLVPSVSGDLAQMIRSSLFSTRSTVARFTFTNVPTGIYDVYAYVWEDNNPQDFYISVDDQIQNFNSGTRGQWKMVGPFAATVESGMINIEAGGGDANISAIELWRRYQYTGRAMPANNARTVSKSIVYPNSISSNLIVNLPETTKESISIKIVDITGKTYLSNTKNLNGEKEFSLEVPYNEMHTGIYFMHLQYGDKKEVIRLNKK